MAKASILYSHIPNTKLVIEG